LADVRAAIHHVLPRFPAVHRAYLFGSVLRPGGMRASSDVDIALEGDLDAATYFAVWRALEQEAVGWALEVIELGPDLHFAASVRERGECVYERADPNAEGRDRR
jgi:predicted nucleotidyltransferase